MRRAAVASDRSLTWQPRRAYAYVAGFGCLAVIELLGSLQARGVALVGGLALASVAAASGVRRHRPVAKGAWHGVLLAMAVFWLGTVASCLAQPHLSRLPRLAMVPHGIVLVGHFIELGAVICLLRAVSSRHDRSAGLDSAVVAVPATAIVVALVVSPLLSSDAIPWPERLTLAAFPALAVVAAALLARLLCLRARPPVSIVLVFMGLISATFSTSWLVILLTFERPVNLGVMALGWLVAPACLGAAASHPSIGSADASHSDSSSGAEGPTRIAVLGVAVLAIPLAVLILRLMGRNPPFVLVPGLGLTLVLLLLRIYGLLRLADRDRLEMRDRGQYLGSVLASASDLILVLGPDGRVQYQSGSLDRFTGDTSSIDNGAAFAFVRSDATPTAWAFFAESLSRPGQTVEAELPAAADEGEPVWLDVSLTNLLSDTVVRGVVAVIRDTTVRRRLETELQRLAFHDSLTALPNRALLLDRIAHAVERSHADHPMALLFIDLDRFKAINDSQGHHVGDDILRAVAARLREAVRPSDTLARLGGDEFAVFVEDGADPNALASRMLGALHSPIMLPSGTFSVSASVGVASGRRSTADDFLRDADLAMYRAKFRGGDQAALYQPEMRAELTARIVTEHELRAALVANEFVLHYQPEIDLHTGRIRGVEALVRWDHPTRGLLAPAEFIEIAETTGLIVPLGRWVLRRATQQASEWRRAGMDIHMAVNMSVKQLDDPNIVNEVLAALDASGLPPEALTLEITESLLINDEDAMVLRLNSLKALGIRLAIDDFGTGYCSLTYLRRFPVDILKIDRSFVSPLGDDEADAILRAQLDLARALDLDTVAEGVEIQTQVDTLIGEGCASAQGYHFSRPLSAEATEDLLLRAPSMLLHPALS